MDWFNGAHQPSFLEERMFKVFNIALPASLLVVTLLLSACATEKEAAPVQDPIVAPAPPEAVVEKPVAEVVAEATPAPAAVAVEEPQRVNAQAAPQAEKPKKVIRKARKVVAKPTPVPVIEPAPVAPTPPPVVEPEVKQPVVVTPPVKEVSAEPGLFEQYWIWLIGLIVIIAGVVLWRMKSKE
jgi:hypothetical protein